MTNDVVWVGAIPVATLHRLWSCCPRPLGCTTVLSGSNCPLFPARRTSTSASCECRCTCTLTCNRCCRGTKTLSFLTVPSFSFLYRTSQTRSLFGNTLAGSSDCIGSLFFTCKGTTLNMPKCMHMSSNDPARIAVQSTVGLHSLDAQSSFFGARFLRPCTPGCCFVFFRTGSTRSTRRFFGIAPLSPGSSVFAHVPGFASEAYRQSPMATLRVTISFWLRPHIICHVVSQLIQQIALHRAVIFPCAKVTIVVHMLPRRSLLYSRQLFCTEWYT